MSVSEQKSVRVLKISWNKKIIIAHTYINIYSLMDKRYTYIHWWQIENSWKFWKTIKPTKQQALADRRVRGWLCRSVAGTKGSCWALAARINIFLANIGGVMPPFVISTSSYEFLSPANYNICQRCWLLCDLIE